MSYGYMLKEEQRLREEIEALLRQAQQTDALARAVASPSSPGNAAQTSRVAPRPSGRPARPGVADAAGGGLTS
jgi:hypothetical protein